MNRYSPYYDPDEQRVRMSIDEKGSWIHVSEVKRLELEAASALRLAVDFEKILIREGGVEGAYERRLVEALRERDEARNQSLRANEIIVAKESNYDLDVRKLVKQRDDAQARVRELEAMLAHQDGAIKELERHSLHHHKYNEYYEMALENGANKETAHAYAQGEMSRKHGKD